MRRNLKIAFGILASAVLLASLVGVAMAAANTTSSQPGYGLRLRAGSTTIDAVSKLLGIKPEDVRAQRQAGKSLLDIAKEKGVDAQKLKDTMLDSRKTLLQERVKDGTLTQEQADDILKQMQERITSCLENGGGHGPGFKGGGMMRHGARGGCWANTNAQ